MSKHTPIKSTRNEWLLTLFSDALSWGMIYGRSMDAEEWERRKKNTAEKYFYLAIGRDPSTELLKALKATKATLERVNQERGGPIVDTIWHGPGETLFDFIDAAIQEAEGTA